MKNFNVFVLSPTLISIALTTLILSITGLVYAKKVRKLQPDECPRGLVLVIEIIIKMVEKLVVDILGVKYKNYTVYFLYLIGYILVGNWLSIIGLDSPAGSYTVTFSLAFVSFIGIYLFAFKHQKWRFFKKFLNPIELVTQFAPLISLSFRLFGNILGGIVIMNMLYSFLDLIWSNIPVLGQVNFLAGFIAPFFHMYFDLFQGSIQALIFGILTLVYWKLQIEEGVENRSKNEFEVNENYRSFR